MPADRPNTQHSALDSLDTGSSPFDSMNMPFDAIGAVDVLLNDLAAARPREPDAKRSARRASTAGPRGGDGRAVLVVDSTPIARKFLSARLQSLGYQAHTAADGEQALAMIEQQAYAIVFCEAALGPMSEIDGLRLCQAIKQKTDHPRGVTPAVVMVTGLTGSTDRVRGALAGCDAYLTKPLADQEFIATLTEVDPLFA